METWVFFIILTLIALLWEFIGKVYESKFVDIRDIINTTIGGCIAILLT